MGSASRVPRASWVFAVLVALVVLGAACGGESPSDTESPNDAHGATSAPPAEQRAGPSVVADSIVLLPPESDARAEMQILLSNVPIPVAPAVGTKVTFHPTSDPVSFKIVGGLPPGGTLRICQSGQCEDLGSSSMLSMAIQAHVPVEITGTWKRPVTVSTIEIGYRNVDYALATEFPSTDEASN